MLKKRKIKFSELNLNLNKKLKAPNFKGFQSSGKSLATKMIVFGIILVLVIFTSLLSIAVSFSKNTLIDITSKQAKMLADQHSASIDEWVNSLVDSTKLVATRKVMNSELDNLIMEQLRQLGQSNREITRIYLIDGTNGQELYSLTGKSGLNFNEKQYFKKAVESKASVISDEEIVPGVEKPMVYIATPVGTNNDDTSRILVAGFSLKDLVKKVESISFLQEGYAFITNSDGLVVAHKQQENNAKMDLKTDENYSEMLGFIKENVSAHVIYDDHGTTSFAAFAPIKTLHWNVVLTAPMDEIYGDVNKMSGILMFTSIPITAIAVVLIWWFAKRISQSLRELASDMQRVGSGDFHVEVKVRGKDELALVGQAMNKMVSELRNLIALVQTQASQLNVAAEELNEFAHGNKEAIHLVTSNIEMISDRVGLQTREVQSAALSVSEISSGVEQVAFAAESTSVATSKTFERAQNGMGLVKDVIQIVREASNEVDRSAKRMHSLKESSKEITNIVQMITSIASQTNLLALNAAIEAARAGEAGRGFSIVASEVRKLAEESSLFSEKIAHIAHSINNEATEMSTNMDDIVTMVGSGLTSVETVGEAFNEILNDIQSAAEQSEAMTAISEEMAAGNLIITSSMERLSSMSGEINESINGVVGSVDEQLQSIARINDNVDSLKKLADELTENIQRFVI